MRMRPAPFALQCATIGRCCCCQVRLEKTTGVTVNDTPQPTRFYGRFFCHIFTFLFCSLSLSLLTRRKTELGDLALGLATWLIKDSLAGKQMVHHHFATEFHNLLVCCIGSMHFRGLAMFSGGPSQLTDGCWFFCA
jgi:hypothetical protein